ncbi:coiled-coil domain-containing protein 73-like [Platichthys flesus]|uniref:coiled-coil domain-containing protein 73-like n=1 Tax=Platichthys flesus TaxID=8260 RepID=UPI002DB7F381|nr:coiled-coil domain-containing protein 73-like [Platichthys flesus]
MHSTTAIKVEVESLSLSSTSCQREGGRTILLQLLEFKTHLLEAVEELHIRKDAETHFEDQISKLVLEKQELEWERESLQHQIETGVTQHTESLTSVKKQFQDKIRNVEEEKGKYQVSAELKDKEINNLKEELRSLQLLKFNLEKKSKELVRKNLPLTQTVDRGLVGEQKLSLQSRSKDSHLNQLGEVEKRFSALSRQCAMVKKGHETLQQNVDEAMRINKKLTSANEKQEANIVSLKKELEQVNTKLIKTKMMSVTHDKFHHGQMATEQHVEKLHQRLRMETEIIKKLEEENVSVRAEKQRLMTSLQHNQQLLLSQTQAVNRVELELQTQEEQHQALKQEHEVMRDRSKALEDKVARLMECHAASVTSWDKEKKVFLDDMESEQQELRSVKEAFDELHGKHTEVSSLSKEQAQHILELEMRNHSRSCLGVSTQVVLPIEPSDELLILGRLQHAAADQRGPEGLDHTGAVTEEQEVPNSPDLFTRPRVNNNLSSSCSHSGTTSNDTNMMSKHITNAGVISESIHIPPSASDDNIVMKDDEGQEKVERVTEQQQDGEDVQREDAEDGGSTGEKRGTTCSADTQEDGQRSAEEAEDTRTSEGETRDEGSDGAEQRGKTGEQTPAAQIPTQTSTDCSAEKSNTLQVVDFMDAETPLVVCDPSHPTESRCQESTEQDADSRYVNEGCGTERGQFLSALGPDESQRSVNQGPESVTQVCQVEVQTPDSEPLTQLPNLSHQVSEKTPEETPAEPLSDCGSALLPSAAQTDVIISISELETTAAQSEQNNPSGINSDTKQTDESSHKHASEECELGRAFVEPQLFPQSQEISEQQKGQIKALILDEDDSGEKSERQANVDTQENWDSEIIQMKTNLIDVFVDITMDTEEDIESDKHQDQMKNDKDEKTNRSEAHLKTSVPSAGPRSSFDLVSVLHQFAQGSEQNQSGSDGRLSLPPSRLTMFPTSKHSRVPLVITRASDLLNASSVSGNPASSARQQQGEWKPLDQTTAADMESRASLSITSLPVSTSFSTVSGLTWPTTTGCSRAAAPVSDPDLEPSFSQEREEQQASFRAQISKIEQFLNTERLRQPKRRKTDN